MSTLQEMCQEVKLPGQRAYTGKMLAHNAKRLFKDIVGRKYELQQTALSSDDQHWSVPNPTIDWKKRWKSFVQPFFSSSFLKCFFFSIFNPLHRWPDFKCNFSNSDDIWFFKCFILSVTILLSLWKKKMTLKNSLLKNRKPGLRRCVFLSWNQFIPRQRSSSWPPRHGDNPSLLMLDQRAGGVLSALCLPASSTEGFSLLVLLRGWRGACF